MIHTASSGSRGKVQDMEIDFLQLQKINDKVLNHLAKCTNTSITKIKKDCDRDFWLDENEWKKYGGCDKIIDKR